eukprot:scaffold128131_cov18-Tisochrysis_lutea.AAC.1
MECGTIADVGDTPTRVLGRKKDALISAVRDSLGLLLLVTCTKELWSPSFGSGTLLAGKGYSPRQASTVLCLSMCRLCPPSCSPPNHEPSFPPLPFLLQSSNMCPDISWLLRKCPHIAHAEHLVILHGVSDETALEPLHTRLRVGDPPLMPSHCHLTMHRLLGGNLPPQATARTYYCMAVLSTVVLISGKHQVAVKNFCRTSLQQHVLVTLDFYLLRGLYATGIRFIIHTANPLVGTDDISVQAMWHQDFPLKDSLSPPSSDFEETFCDYVEQMKLPVAVQIYYLYSQRAFCDYVEQMKLPGAARRFCQFVPKE